MARSEDPVLILSVFGSYLVLKSSIDKCKLAFMSFLPGDTKDPEACPVVFVKTANVLLWKGYFKKSLT